MKKVIEKLKKELDVTKKALAGADKSCFIEDNEHVIAEKKALEISKSVELAHHEWMDALDTINDAIFMHDKDFRIMRCNLSYKNYAGLSFKQIIGRPYFEVFPKQKGPLANCLKAIEKTVANGEKEYIEVGENFFSCRAYIVTDKHGDYLYSVHILENITESRRLEQALQKSEIFLKQEKDFSARLIETAPVIILELGLEGQIVRFNSYMEDITGYSLNEVEGKDWFYTFLPKNEIEETRELFQKDITGMQTKGNISALLTKDGRKLQIEWYDTIQKDTQGNIFALLCMGIDVTIRETNKKILALHADIASIFVTSADDEILNDVLNLVLKALESPFGAFGYLDKNGDLIIPTMTRQVWDKCQMEDKSIVFPKQTWGDSSWVHSLNEKRAIYSNKESTNIPKGHITIQRHIAMPILFNGESIGLLQIANKLTDYTDADIKSINLIAQHISPLLMAHLQRKDDKEALLLREEEFRTLAESMPQIVWIAETDGMSIYFNNRWTEYTGLTMKESLDDGWKKAIHPDDEHQVWDAWKLSVLTGADYSIEARLRNEDGIYRWWLIRSVPFKNGSGKIIKWFGTCTDIDDIKMAQLEILKINRALKTLSACNLALVLAKDEDTLLKEVISLIVESGGYSFATVYYVLDDEKSSIVPMAWSGTENNYFISNNSDWGSTEYDQLPVSIAIRNSNVQIYRDIARSSAFQPWKDAVLSHGYLSCIVFPLYDEGEAFGALSIYSDKLEKFDKDEVLLLEEMTSDLSYGIIAQRMSVKEKQHDQILRESLEQFIQAIVATVEARDPYTAGHQQRVGKLATAIAVDMGLPENIVKGVHFAAIIHDLGKINIPAEILSKPGKISDIEHMLIQTHSQAGYEILKDLKFPWPIAEIILQHHEKLDGSGYPRGLKSENILLEAKIITVADVIEAMSSHRPYRKALEIEVALDEIRRGRGTLYDSVVVDTCLNLFTQKGFMFEEEN